MLMQKKGYKKEGLMISTSDFEKVSGRYSGASFRPVN
jgi:hypothetical protein